jgi:hypothetical protein
MKKVILIMIFILIFCSSWINAFAGPFLVCDPQADVMLYDVYADGTIIVTDHPAESDGSLRYELTSPMPSTSFEAVAKNVWGESPKSDPYISPSLSTKPQGLRLTE